MFSDKIEPIVSNGAATIGAKYIIPKGIGKTSWSWIDDKGQLHTNKLNNVIFLTDSTTNIISATVLAESTKYY